MRATWTWVWVVVLVLCTASSALAREKRGRRKARPAEVEAPAEPEPEPEPIAEEPPPEDSWGNPDAEPPAQETAADETSEGAENNAADDAADEEGTEEDTASGKPEWWIGPYLHGVWVPSFMLGMFLDEPPTIGNAAFGVTATHRDEDGFSFVLGLGYVGYGFEGPLQKSGDPDEDTEWVTSGLGMLHVTGAMLWSTELSPMFAFEYGLGLDFGIVLGDMERSEAYRTGSGKYAPCSGPSNPLVAASPTSQYCEVALRNGVPVATNSYDEFGAHYGVIEERVPPVALIPALPQLALRFQPHKNLAFKLEAAYGIFQFKLGLSAAFGLDT